MRSFLTSPGDFVSRDLINILGTFHSRDKARLLFVEGASALLHDGYRLSIGPATDVEDGDPHNKDNIYPYVVCYDPDNSGHLRDLIRPYYGYYRVNNCNVNFSFEDFVEYPNADGSARSVSLAFRVGYLYKKFQPDRIMTSYRSSIVLTEAPRLWRAADQKSVFAKVFDLATDERYNTNEIDSIISELARSNGGQLRTTYRVVSEKINQLWGAGEQADIRSG